MSEIIDSVQAFVSSNKEALTVGSIGVATGAILGAGTTAAIIGSSNSKSTTKKKKKTVKRRKKRTSKRNKKKYYPEPRGMKYSRRKIRRTKNGQPYIILASGKAKFISKKSAKLRRRRKGGTY